MQSVPISTNDVSLNPGQAMFTHTLCHKVCRWLAAYRWFSSGTPVSSTNKTNLQIYLKYCWKLKTPKPQTPITVIRKINNYSTTILTLMLWTILTFIKISLKWTWWILNYAKFYWNVLCLCIFLSYNIFMIISESMTFSN